MGDKCSVSLFIPQAMRDRHTLALRHQIGGMPTIDEIRRLNLAKLVDELGGNNKLAEKVGVSESQMGQWVNGAKESTTGKPRGMRLASCHRIEDATGKPRGWLDVLHEDTPAPAALPSAPSQTTLTIALPVVLAALADLPPARAVSVRAQLDQVMGHPEMHDDVLAELQHLFSMPAAPPGKRTGTGG